MTAQIPCPVMLVDGKSSQDTIILSFRNKGKLPIQQLSLTCAPSPYQKGADSTCHIENGVFFPGMTYSINVGYPHANKHQIVISVKAAVTNTGARWTPASPDKCRSLRIVHKR
ncbi:MAG TPA: hypothetical protein VGG95_11875 [Edaphobacter sp.]